MYRFFLPIAIVLIVGFGVAEGLWTDRWSTAMDVDAAAKKLEAVPQEVGDWIGTDVKLLPNHILHAELSGYVMRKFKKRGSDRALEILLVCGRAGPTSLHSPEVCFEGLGMQATGVKRHQLVKAPGLPEAADFLVARFKDPEANHGHRIYWTWTATGTWYAPANPRVSFGRYRYLYKLYLVRSLSDLQEPLEDDYSIEFLKQFMPEVQKALFTKGETGESRSR